MVLEMKYRYSLVVPADGHSDLVWPQTISYQGPFLLFLLKRIKLDSYMDT